MKGHKFDWRVKRRPMQRNRDRRQHVQGGRAPWFIKTVNRRFLRWHGALPLLPARVVFTATLDRATGTTIYFSTPQ